MLNDAESSKTPTIDGEALPDWLREIRDTTPQVKPLVTKEFAPSPSQANAPQKQQVNYKFPTLTATLEIWKKVFSHPNLQTFQQEKNQANFITAFVWMGVVGLVGGLVSSVILMGLMGTILYFTMEPTDIALVFSEMGLFALIGVILNSVMSAIFAPVYLLVASAVLFVIAKLFGGKGDFEEQTYLVATFFAPFYLALRVLGVVPIIGWFVLLIYFVNLVVPGRYAIQATHNLSSKKSLYAVLIPIGTVATFYGLFLSVWSFFALRALSSWWSYW